MQKISANFNQADLAAPFIDARRALFVPAATAYMVTAAMLALLAPIQLKAVVVFLFAGPHNWIELRYMLSRLPARWKNSRWFFNTSFVGVAVLSLSFVAIMVAMMMSTAPVDLLRICFSLWGSALLGWLLVLAHQRRLIQSLPQRLLAYLCGACCLAACWLGPEWFSVGLVYVHPLLSLAIFDRELERSRRDLLAGYRAVLIGAPAFLLLFWWQSCMALPQSPIANLILDQSGVQIMTMVPPHFVISTLVFFDLLHYGVWLLGIPLMSAGWSGYRARAMPITTQSNFARNAISALLLGSSLAAATLWFCFTLNFETTYTVYFILAVVHVLAEMPFLIWSTPCKSS